jgi:rare lipoprotein A
LLPFEFLRKLNRLLTSLGLVIFLGACACSDYSIEQRTLAPFRATSRPYKIKGIWYYPQQHYEFEEVGTASWYGERDGCHSLPTATGRPFDMFAFTCAHKTLPLPCMIRVTNLENGREIDLEVIDRGPFKYSRILDVSSAAAKQLGFYQKGTAAVHIKTLVQESLNLPSNRKAFAKRGRNACSPPKTKKQILKPGPTLDDLLNSIE